MMDASRKTLLNKYDPKVWTSIGEHFVRKFESEHTGSFRSMSSDYRADIKVL